MKEIPKKWAVKRTINNSQVLNKWNNKHPLYEEQDRHWADSVVDEDYFYSDRPHTRNLNNDYTLISFEYFEYFILNKLTSKPKHEDLTFLKDLLIQNGIN